MTQMYPDGYEPRLFIANACEQIGAEVSHEDPVIIRHEDKNGNKSELPSFRVNGKNVLFLLDNRMPDNQWQNKAATEAAKDPGNNLLVCCAQKVDADRHGFKWLPLAITPGYKEADKPVSPRYDISFVGYLNDPPRQSLFNRLQQNYNANIQSGVFGDEANAAYHAGAVGLNITAFYGSQFAYDVNMRVFEICACKRALVTPRVPGMEQLGFIRGENCLMYDNAVALEVLLDTILANRRFREDIAAAGYALARNQHTYAHRGKQILGWIEDGG